MKSTRILAAGALCAILASAPVVRAAERSAPPRPSTATRDAFTESERRALLSWAMAQPEVKAVVAGHRTRLLRVWSEVVKGESGPRRRATLVLRDYDAGTARGITVDLASGGIELRDLPGVQPSAEEMNEATAIIRRDPALARLAANPKLELIGGFHNRAPQADDPCSRDVCLDFAFMRPDYQGPERYVIVDLSRGVVVHHDFRARPGEPRPRMTEKAGP
jgi:hypothetical protein